jgi:hypothetical protein
MKEEAPDELVRAQRTGAETAGLEDDAILPDGAEAGVGDGDAVCIAGEVGQDLQGPSEGTLGVDDPASLVELVPQAGEGDGVGEVGRGAGEADLAGPVGATDPVEELATEEGADHGDREKELAAGGDPARPVARETTSGDDAVEVGMEPHVARPGVKDGGDTQLGAKASGGEFLEAVGRGGEEQVVDERGVGQRDGAERLGEGEDDVKVWDREQELEATIEPGFGLT